MSYYNINLEKQFRVLSNEFTALSDIYKIIKFFPTVSICQLNIIYNFLEEDKSIKIFCIPIIHQNINTGYRTAHFLIQQDQDDNGKYIFIGNINYHIDDEIYSTIDEYFSSSPNTYYSTEQLLNLIDNQYISLFCDIFDDDNYYNYYYNYSYNDSYNDSYNSYFENLNIDNTYNFLEYNDENGEDKYSENLENYISEPYEINESSEPYVINESSEPYVSNERG
jgi:hypothetical protein